MARAPKSKIVVAVGSSSGSRGASSSGVKSGLSHAIETAMSQAVLACSAKGITDPDKVRAAMLKAREKVKDDLAKAERAAVRLAKKRDTQSRKP